MHNSGGISAASLLDVDEAGTRNMHLFPEGQWSSSGQTGSVRLGHFKVDWKLLSLQLNYKIKWENSYNTLHLEKLDQKIRSKLYILTGIQRTNHCDVWENSKRV